MKVSCFGCMVASRGKNLDAHTTPPRLNLNLSVGPRHPRRALSCPKLRTTTQYSLSLTAALATICPMDISVNMRNGGEQQFLQQVSLLSSTFGHKRSKSVGNYQGKVNAINC